MTAPTLSPPIPAIIRSADHRYTFDGKVYPGVTGILSVIDKSGPLKQWAANETALAAIAHLGDLPKMLETAGPEGVKKFLASSSNWTNTKARDLGTEVHEYAEKLLRDEITVTEVPERSRAHVKQYLDWWTASKWKVRALEAMVVHPEAGYGGTIDLLCRDRDGLTVLADIKTGKAVYQEAVLQLTAYGLATYIQPPGGHLARMPRPIDRHVILHVTADGVREVEVNVGTTEHMAWLACIDLALWRDTMKGKRL